MLGGGGGGKGVNLQWTRIPFNLTSIKYLEVMFKIISK